MMDLKSCASNCLSSLHSKTSNVPDKLPENPRYEGQERFTGRAVVADVDIDLREVYFMMMQFLSVGPCQKTFAQLSDELMEHQLLPRRYHAWYSRTGLQSGDANDDGVSLPLTYETLVHRYPHIAKDHLVRLLKQLLLGSPRSSPGTGNGSNAGDVPTLLGSGSFSLLSCHLNERKQIKVLPRYLRWPHMQIDQVHGLHMRAIGGGFTRHHRASSIQAACYAIAKPSTMVQKMQNITRLRGHRYAVYCAIFDRSGRYVITGADDRLVKIWSMETAFCLASCRGHEGDITDLAVSSNNALVASASNDFVIRVWRLLDGYPISILQGHTGAVTAIAFTPRSGSAYQLLSSSDDGTCRIWDARNSQCKPRLYVPKPVEADTGTVQQNHQILCCAYNANGTVFVTGSSDTFARVWYANYAGKFSADEQPCHEIDLLAGHENDVNYVQFSGCATTARSTTTDASKEDHSARFKNSWFTHDNIVTCSRDGSAIIWTPRSRRSHGKIGRWTKAYHLKVPPPPLPPQPPRGGPRRRILPTPRGVNMIVWSLDNRFVLAAIMDCRICVWNAADGSLVHCLTGHTESTYVLDVHPFNPRIAMSAGYDGKTIIWDIWEGTPVRVFEIGRGKLVDGKFSSDGTSIVLSDDVGQIYLLNTGQGESQKDAKYDQFFLGDYRPLVRDAAGNVVDQESQLLPHQRNLQDPLCDSSMIPYPEPYQSIYQRRRLGLLGLEWRPSSLRFAVGPDFSLGDDYQMPLPDPEAIIDVPEPLDATLWEPENEVMPDDTDSEYDVGEEYPSAKEQESLSNSSSEDIDFHAASFEHNQRQKDGLRRSKRKNEKAEAVFASSGRRVRRKRVEDCAGSSSQIKRVKKSRIGHKGLKKNSLDAKLSRPQRAAARNAMFYKIPETSSPSEDGDGSEIYSSDSGSFSQDSAIQDYEPDWDVGNQTNDNHEELLSNESLTPMNPVENPVVPSDPEASIGNKKKLVLKLSIRDSKKSSHIHSACDNRNKSESSSSLPRNEEDQPKRRSDGYLALDSLEATSQKPSQSVNKVLIRCKGLGNNSSDTSSSKVVHDVDSPNELSVGADIPVEVSCSAHLQKSSEGDAGRLIKESADAVNNGNSHEIKERVPSVATRIRIKSSRFLKQENTPKLKSAMREKELAADSVPKTCASSYGSGEENISSTSYDDYSPGSDFPDAETDLAYRTRSMEVKASTCNANQGNRKLKLRKGDSSMGKSDPSRDFMLKSNTSTRSMSSRSRQDHFSEDTHGPQSISLSIGKKISWLLLCEHEPGYRYIPQLGDQVAYLRQGHEEYLQQTGGRGPLESMRQKLKDVEICLVEGLDYATAPGSGESCCKLTLKFIDPLSCVFGRTFRLTLPELLNDPDFLVEKTWYDTAVSKNWTPGEVCSVWWKNESGEGGSWWEGWIVSATPKSTDFPDSPWERYAVQYKSDPSPQLHSPWELHDLEGRFEPLHIDFNTRNKVLDCFSKLERRKDDGFMKLDQVSQRTDFLNRFPVPLSPDVIRSRLKHNYYRSVDAVKHDIDVMISNALSYFSKNAVFSRKMKRLSEYFERTLTTLL